MCEILHVECGSFNYSSTLHLAMFHPLVLLGSLVTEYCNVIWAHTPQCYTTNWYNASHQTLSVLSGNGCGQHDYAIICLYSQHRDGSCSKWLPVPKVWEQLCDNHSNVKRNTGRRPLLVCCKNVPAVCYPIRKLRKQTWKFWVVIPLFLSFFRSFVLPFVLSFFFIT